MKLFQRLVWVALALALAIGSVQTLVQQRWAVPIILKAETFEDQKAEPVAAAMAAHEHADGAAAAHEHHHDADAPEWAPEDGLERSVWTWVANVLHVFALAMFAQVVLAAWTLRRGPAGSTPATLRLGLGLALAGWLSLHLWPALGLYAEIPGMDAARLGSRQGWWLLAVAGAASACALLALARGTWRWLAAAAALALPFAIGAPHIAADPLAGFSPEAQAVLRPLGEQFIVVTHAIAAGLWLMLGLAGSAAFVRWVQPLIVAPAPARAEAAAAGA